MSIIMEEMKYNCNKRKHLAQYSLLLGDLLRTARAPFF